MPNSSHLRDVINEQPLRLIILQWNAENRMSENQMSENQMSENQMSENQIMPKSERLLVRTDQVWISVGRDWSF